MEEDQEYKHSCKFCNRKFPCGRSLGGHMRSHMTLNSAETDEKLQKRKGSVNGGSGSTNSYMGFEASGQVGYGLRENPKKTWRISDSNNENLRQGKVCKECGKGFQSWKALFGHMRCHTERLPHSLEQDSWSGENQKLDLDSQSDNEGSTPRRRSRRTRYGKSCSFSLANNGSCSVSEIEQEEEDLAICLMMLSRDVGSNWGGTNSVLESSDNNSAILEVRSLEIVKGITEKIDGDLGKINVPREKGREFHDSDMGNARFRKKRSEFGGFESGSLRDMVKKVESDVSDDGFERDDEFKKSRIDCSDIELGRSTSKRTQLNCSVTELGKGSSSTKETKSNQLDSELGKHSSRKRAKHDAYDTELGRHFHRKVRYDNSDTEFGKDQYKKNKYECATCNKTFHSYQALGGHRASHKKVKGCFASRIESSENSIETNFSPIPTTVDRPKSCKIETLIDRGKGGETSNGKNKIKGHECPICLKVFASGQALGGHKRSHQVGNSDPRAEACQTIVIQQELPKIPDLLDLNLPAPVDDENNNGHIGFKSWWVGSNHKHEPLVGLISN
ncbi:uncharacterized protein LOC143863675 [Tasmannia lanceolata]|uniref:uncharacterized protein LOC143863675 n=1 Tax=Tasmannia lanceolata TaxID=3420 RepID=UPI004063F831